MPSNWKWKTTFLLIIVLSSIWVLYPTFFKIKEGSTQDKIFNKDLAINLGLDLRGGTHLVLGIQFEKLMDEKLNRTGSDLQSDLKSEGLMESLEKLMIRVMKLFSLQQPRLR